MDGCGMQANSTDFCLMESGLDKQVLTNCLSTMCFMPVGMFKTEMCSYSLVTGVGIMTSRGHLVDSRTNSSLRVAGRPEQGSKPALAPDLFNMKERAAKRGLRMHMPGVFRSAVRSPFMSPQSPTARDFKNCGATTSTTDPFDKTIRPCLGM